MAEQKGTDMSKDEQAFKERLDKEREDTLQGLLKVVEQAYRHKLIAMEAGPHEIVYTIRIPHEARGPKLELFAFAGNMPV